MKKRIVIFDDNENRREGLELLINLSEHLECTGVFNDCRNVLEHISDCQPDLVLMDIDMPYVNGIEGVKIIRSKHPSLKILMQTVFEDDEKIFDCICAGADGYVLKKSAPVDLLKAMDVVLEGGSAMTPSIARQVLRLINRQVTPKENLQDFKLTAREHEILSHLVNGFSYKMIAEKCFISLPTVNSHIQNIFEKLQVHSGTEAVAKAINHKLTN